jgi:predicted MPP superfamily phosphohydrolase
MWIRLIITLVVIVAVVIGIYHDTHNFKLRYYTVKTDKIKGEKTFVFLTDLHGYVFGKDNDKLISAIEALEPDGILCAGDMFNAKAEKGVIRTGPGFDLLTALVRRFPVYVANGNHEEKVKLFTKEHGNLFDRYKSSLKRAGVNYLENDSVVLEEDNIRITGLDLSLEYFKKFVKKKMEPGLLNDKLGEIRGDEASRLQILIAHNPQYFPEYADWGADITVSGHVHGGIIRLPLLGGVISPTLALFPKYDGGKYVRQGKTMILSRGLGTHTIHVRLGNPGEVSVIKVLGGD